MNFNSEMVGSQNNNRVDEKRLDLNFKNAKLETIEGLSCRINKNDLKEIIIKEIGDFEGIVDIEITIKEKQKKKKVSNTFKNKEDDNGGKA